MKVKISYNLELDNVPHHASHIMKDLESSLIRAAEDLGEISKKISERGLTISKIVEEISSVRVSMADVDSLLEDLTNILIGYEQTLIAPQPTPQNQAGEPDAKQ